MASRFGQSSRSCAILEGAVAEKSRRIEPAVVSSQKPELLRLGWGIEVPDPSTVSFIRLEYQMLAAQCVGAGIAVLYVNPPLQSGS